MTTVKSSWKSGLPGVLAAAILLLQPAAESLSAAQVTVRLLTGAEQAGELAGLTPDQVTLQQDGLPRAFAIRDLQAVVFAGQTVARPDPTTLLVQLVDESQLRTTGYTVKSGQATCVLADGSLELPTRVIRSVRLRPPSKPLDDQWREIRTGRAEGDVVAVRRSDTSLDQLEGVLQDINDETVQFVFEDEEIPVRRSRLEGIVYFHPAGSTLPETACKVQTVDGTVWNARSLALADATLLLTTPAGVERRLPVAQAVRLDFSTGNVVYVSDLEPERIEWTPFVATQISADRLAQLYDPRRDRSFEGEQLWLTSGTTVTRYQKGLSVHSRTLLTYRLAGDYRRFTAVAGIDSRLRGRGNVELVVYGDDRELLRQVITGKDPPLPVDLDIQKVQRLKILVDFGQTADVADHLNLCEARVIK